MACCFGKMVRIPVLRNLHVLILGIDEVGTLLSDAAPTSAIRCCQFKTNGMSTVVQYVLARTLLLLHICSIEYFM